MDCFNTPYYSLNRRTLMLLGQWPYQNPAERIRMWITYSCVIVTGAIVQVARAVNADPLDFDLCVEFVSETLVCTITIIRYFTFTVYGSKIRTLMDTMKTDWQHVTNNNEHEILCDSTEETRLFSIHYSTLAYSGLLMFVITMLSSPLLIYTPLFNESCPILAMYSKEYIVDPQKYCFLLLLHICIVISFIFIGALSTDLMYMCILYHAVGMFKIVCYRFEHAFDLCTQETTYAAGRASVYKRIASAVECHRNTIRFSEEISKIFQLPNLISLMLTLVSIAVALYWAAISKGQGVKPAFAVVIGGGIMLHLFFMDLPSQKLIDNSEAVIFRAYAGMWYKAPAKEQCLLILSMQRGLKPTAMVMGKLHTATLESFAAEVQASFSYFTLLMSMQ